MMTPFGYSFGHYCLFSYDVMKVFWAFYASYQYFFMEDDTGGVFFLVYGIILSFTIAIGKNRALKIYDQFASQNTSCFWGISGSNITPNVQFHEIFVTKNV